MFKNFPYPFTYAGISFGVGMGLIAFLVIIPFYKSKPEVKEVPVVEQVVKNDKVDWGDETKSTPETDWEEKFQEHVEYAKKHDNRLPEKIVEFEYLGKLQKYETYNNKTKFEFKDQIIYVKGEEYPPFFEYDLVHTNNRSSICRASDTHQYLHWNGKMSGDPDKDSDGTNLRTRCYGVY